MVDWNQKITSLGLTWGRGWDKRGHRAGTWGGFRGQMAGTGTWGGFRGQAWWIRTRESDLQGFTWGHGTGTRVRILDFGPEGGSPGMCTCVHLSMSLRACFSASACRHV